MARSKQQARKKKLPKNLKNEVKKQNMAEQLANDKQLTENDVPGPTDNLLITVEDVTPAPAEIEVVTLAPVEIEVVTPAPAEMDIAPVPVEIEVVTLPDTEEGEISSSEDETSKTDCCDIIVDITGDDIELSEDHMDAEPAQGTNERQDIKCDDKLIVCEDKPTVCEDISTVCEAAIKMNNAKSNTVPETSEATPLYDYSCVLSEGILTDKNGIEEPEKKKAPTSCCWNCEGNHNLPECPEPRNQRVITQNRQLFLKNKNSMPNVRYHQDVEQKYAGVKPGVISDKLREKLGLQDWQAPEFIYRMRVLGYPPGWLKDAEVHRADMAIIDGDGSAISHPEDEEGEVKASFKYEPDRLISYPGFNVPFNSKIKDECHYYGCPQMQYCHSRDEFECYMKENRASKYKRKKLQHTTSLTKCNKSSEEADNEASEGSSEDKTLKDSNGAEIMEIDVPKTGDDKSTIDCDESADSQDEKSSTVVIEDDSSTESSVVEIDPTPIAKPIIPTAVDSPSTPCVGVQKSVLQQSVSFNYGVGTPDSSSCKQSPSADKWSVGISGHIDFDNIPESTGKWKKMNKIMGRVRLEMSNLHDDD